MERFSSHDYDEEHACTVSQASDQTDCSFKTGCIVGPDKKAKIKIQKAAGKDECPDTTVLPLSQGITGRGPFTALTVLVKLQI